MRGLDLLSKGPVKLYVEGTELVGADYRDRSVAMPGRALSGGVELRR